MEFNGMTKTHTIAVVGTGTMGRGIAQWAASFGHTVLLYDGQAGAAETAIGFIKGLLDRSLAKGKLEPAEHVAILGRLKPVAAMCDLAAAGIVIEAIVERVDAKQQLFVDLEAIVAGDAILASNTSSLSVTEIAARCSEPGRVAGLHFFNPVPLMRVVEVIPGERTSPETIARLSAFVATTRHHAVVATDTPGFLVNHAGRGLNTEGLRIVQEGVAAPADIDRVMTEALGFPMGPFELFDLTGLDVSGKVLEYIYDGFFQEPRYRPSPWPRRRIAAGMFGRKGGGGFYAYQDGRKIMPPEPEPGDAPSEAPVWIGEVDDAFRTTLCTLLASGGATVNEAQVPAIHDAILLAPLGLDATEAALAGGFDPARVVCVDPFGPQPQSQPQNPRLTLMGTPVTQENILSDVADALRRGGARVTRIHDSPGFIGQRVMAMIVNIACEICQQRIASPQDVDQAVRLGLGYPAGPLTLGDTYGPARILTILERLQEQTGDPRYRPSLWLRRRARLGTSLLLAER